MVLEYVRYSRELYALNIVEKYGYISAAALGK